jgi:hypothetical protein
MQEEQVFLSLLRTGSGRNWAQTRWYLNVKVGEVEIMNPFGGFKCRKLPARFLHLTNPGGASDPGTPGKRSSGEGQGERDVIRRCRARQLSSFKLCTTNFTSQTAPSQSGRSGNVLEKHGILYCVVQSALASILLILMK